MANLKKTFRSWVRRIIQIRNRLFALRFVRFASGVARAIGEDYVGIMAAGLSYYTFLSLFPMLLGLVALLGFMVPSAMVYEIIFGFLQQIVPISTEIIESNIRNITQLRGTLGIISIVGLIFGGTAVFSALSLTINRAWRLWPRPVYIRKPQEFLMVLIIGLLILLLLGISSLLSVLSGLALPGISLLLSIFPRIISVILTTGVILLVYKYIPSIAIRWRDIWRGALIASAMFQLALFGFAVFLRIFAEYELIYGSLASLVVILIWIYVSSFILILGAEINAVFYRMYHSSR